MTSGGRHSSQQDLLSQFEILTARTSFLAQNPPGLVSNSKFSSPPSAHSSEGTSKKIQGVKNGQSKQPFTNNKRSSSYGNRRSVYVASPPNSTESFWIYETSVTPDFSKAYYNPDSFQGEQILSNGSEYHQHHHHHHHHQYQQMSNAKNKHSRRRDKKDGLSQGPVDLPVTLHGPADDNVEAELNSQFGHIPMSSLTKALPLTPDERILEASHVMQQTDKQQYHHSSKSTIDMDYETKSSRHPRRTLSQHRFFSEPMMKRKSKALWSTTNSTAADPQFHLEIPSSSPTSTSTSDSQHLHRRVSSATSSKGHHSHWRTESSHRRSRSSKTSSMNSNSSAGQTPSKGAVGAASIAGALKLTSAPGSMSTSTSLKMLPDGQDHDDNEDHKAAKIFDSSHNAGTQDSISSQNSGESSIMSSLVSKDSKTASTTVDDAFQPTIALKPYKWCDLKSKLEDAMLNVSASTQTIPTAWLDSDTDKWTDGFSFIDEGGSLNLIPSGSYVGSDGTESAALAASVDSSNTHIKDVHDAIKAGVPCITVPDLRNCTLSAFPSKGRLNLESTSTKIVLGASSESDYIRLCALLLLWTNLKPSGILSKTFTPPIFVLKDSTSSSRHSSITDLLSLQHTSMPNSILDDENRSPSTPSRSPGLTTPRQVRASHSIASLESANSSLGREKGLAKQVNSPSGIITPVTPVTPESDRRSVKNQSGSGDISPEVLHYSLSHRSEETLEIDRPSSIKHLDDAADTDDLLISHCKAYIPNLKKKTNKVANAVPLSGESTDNTTFYRPGSAFKGAEGWITVTAILSRYSLLQILDEETGLVILEVELHRILASNVRHIDYSLFENSRIIYIDASDGLMSNLSLYSRGVTAIYLQLSTDEQYEDWLSSLKAFSRKLVYAPTTGDISEALRVSRKVRISIMEAKVDKSKSSNTESPGSLTTNDDAVGYSPFCNPYVEVSYENRAWCRTHVSWGKKDPIWRDTFVFEDLPSPTTMKLTIKRRLGSKVSPAVDPVIGHIFINDEELRKSTDTAVWHTVTKGNYANTPKANPSMSPDLSDSKSYPCMKLRLKISCEETSIMSGGHYSEFEKLLDDIPMRTAVQLSKSLNDISGVANLCLRYYLTKNLAIEWLSDLIDVEAIDIGSQVGAAPEEFRRNIENTLFRGNSLLTKSMEAYMRIIGERYLDDVVGTFVKKLVENRAFLEIDPARIVNTAQYISANGAKSVDAFLDENRKKLKQYMQFLWALIKNSLEDMPFSFKILFSQLRKSIHKHILVDFEGGSGNKLETEKNVIVNNSISGFLFLRFFCPAILSPKLFNIVRAQLTPQIQRSLTLVAKITQGFANRVKFGQKEPWMMPMNEFMVENEEQLSSFFSSLALCDADEHTLAERMIVVGPDGQLDVSKFEDRPMKQSPVELPMSDKLSNPYLFDRYECLQKLVDTWIKKKGDTTISSLSVEELAVAKVITVIYQIRAHITNLLNQPEKLKTDSIRQLVDNTKLDYNRETGFISLFSAGPLESSDVSITASNDKGTLSSQRTTGAPSKRADGVVSQPKKVSTNTKEESPTKKYHWSTRFLRRKS